MKLVCATNVLVCQTNWPHYCRFFRRLWCFLFVLFCDTRHHHVTQAGFESAMYTRLASNFQVAKDIPEFPILRPLPSGCFDYGCKPPHLVCVVLGMYLGAFCIWSKHSTSWAYPSPTLIFFTFWLPFSIHARTVSTFVCPMCPFFRNEQFIRKTDSLPNTPNPGWL